MQLPAIRVCAALLALLAAGPAAADCLPVPAMEFGTAADTQSPPSVAAFMRGTGEEADAAWRHPGHPSANEAASCAVHWIASWAAQGAWLEELSSGPAEAERAQSLAGAGLAYLKVRGSATDEQRETIERWLIQASDLAASKIAPGDARRYWLGLAMGAAAIASGSDRHWDAARGIANEAAAAIGANGALQDKPLQAHIFAAMPLVTLATLARFQGEDFYALGNNAIDRLADYTAKGLAVEPTINPGAGWSQLYALHAPDSLAAKIPMPRSYQGLGGDVQMLVRSLEPIEPE